MPRLSNRPNPREAHGRNGRPRPACRVLPPLPALPALTLLAAAVGSAWAAAPIPRAATVAPRVALPVRATDPLRTAGDQGQFRISQPQPRELRIDQASARAIVNWDSFNVGAGHTVRFVQPDKGSTLNKVWDANPSVIQGRIAANGEVLLQNTNGVIFGATARVDTGRFVATALRVSEAAYLKNLRGILDGGPAFAGGDGETAGYVSVERGAEIRSAAGGDVLLLGPRVFNEGRIETPDGQTVLGAGQTVWLVASGDPAQRGLIVGIRPFASADREINTVTQAESRSYRTVNGETVPDDAPLTGPAVSRVNGVIAERGSISLVGLAIRQHGLLQATTAVKGANGTIQLLAQADVNPLAERPIAGRFVPVPEATALGSVVLGPTSVTEVRPEADRTRTQIDSETFNRSLIRIEGERIQVQGGARIAAPSGRIELLASDRPDRSVVFNPNNFDLSDHSRDASRIVVERGAVIDAAGLKEVQLDAERHQMSGRLFQIELADVPVQRDGVLYREQIDFDGRRALRLANVAGFYNTIARSAEELSTTGGTISIQADGGVAIDNGARLDISGGSLRYAAGSLRTSLVRQGTNWIPVHLADPGLRYDELSSSKARMDAGTAFWRIEPVPAYTEGRSAGMAVLAGRRVWFGGDLRAQVTLGLGQDGRANGSTPPTAGVLTLGRARETDSSLPSVGLQSSPSRDRPGAMFADPLAADIDLALAPTLVLSTDLLQAGGLGGLQAYVSGRFTLAGGASLQLPPLGQLLVQASAIGIDGQVRSAGGRIELTTLLSGRTDRHDIELGAAAALDTSGAWQVDSATLGNEGTDATVLNGGSIALNAAHSLVATSGARLDVAAGARRSGSSLSTGRAGSIALALNFGADPAVALPGTFDGFAATLSGHDFGGGGSLSVSGLPKLDLGPGGDAQFDAAFFSDRGFGSIALSSLGDVTLRTGLALDLRLANWLPFEAPGVADEQGRFAAVGVQPVASRRAAVSLSLSASGTPNRLQGLAGAGLSMQTGARLATEAGGRLTLTARRSLYVDGSLSAPGGRIAMTLQGLRGGTETAGVFEDTQGFDATQALWLGRQARLNVAGTAELQADTLGRPAGTLYGGGSIALTAERGYLIAEAGSVLDLRGHAATLLVPQTGRVQTLAADGGSLTLSTPEGLHLAASLLAAPGSASTPGGAAVADGGSLSILLGLAGRERKTNGPAYSTDPRQLRITSGSVAPLGANPGGDLSLVLGNGSGLIATPRLEAAGFSRISLKADDRIVAADTATLAAPVALVLDSPGLGTEGSARLSLRSTHVSWGDLRRAAASSHEQVPQGSGGDGSLFVQAGLIELYGHTALLGLQDSTFTATRDLSGGDSRRDGEIRLIGVARGTEPVASGSLSFAGRLELRSGLLGAATLSDYAVTGLGADARLVTRAPEGGSTAAAPLSALARLSLKAATMELAGVLHQPFGQVTLQADTLRVADGAVLSVNGNGLSVPVGNTVNGRQWQYRATGLYRTDGSAKPQDPGSNPDIRVLDALPAGRSLNLQAGVLDLATGARLDAAGGGSLTAWEFIAGVGGSSDYLARSGLYAVVPGWAGDFAPHDAQVLAGGGPAAGARLVVEMAGSALAPGHYTLLPARYATLPGAVVVSLAADQGRQPLTQALQRDDGSAIVTGRLSQAGAAGSGLAASRILVEPAATVAGRARLDITDLSHLLADQAQRLDRPAPALPSDAGRLTLVSARPFTLAADIRLAGVAGTGATADATGGRLEVALRDGGTAVVDDIAAPTSTYESGWTLLDAGRIGAAGAGTVVIGGTLDGATLSPLSAQVAVATRTAPLRAGEVLLTAGQSVALDAHSRIETAAAAAPAEPRTLHLAGDAAYLVASGLGPISVRHDAPTSGNATLRAADDAHIVAPVQRLGAAGALDLAPTLALRGSTSGAPVADLGLAARALLLGVPLDALGQPLPPEPGSSRIEGQVLDAAMAAQRLHLGASQALRFAGSRRIDADAIGIDAPIVAGTGATDRIELRARDIELRNRQGQAPTAPAAPAGILLVQATPSASSGRTGGLLIGHDDDAGQPMRLDFEQVGLVSTGDLMFRGAGQLQTEADVVLGAARIGAATGARHGLQTGGGLRIERPDGAVTLGGTLGQGAAIGLRAGRIDHRGRIELPSGRLTLTATGADDSAGPALRIGAGALATVTGVTLPSGRAATVSAPGGALSLQAEAGSVQIGGSLHFAGAGAAAAGSLDLRAGAAVDLHDTAAFDGRAAQPADSGRLRLEATELRHQGVADARLDPWVAAMQAGGVEGEVQVRLRSGDLTLEAATTLRAGRIELAADAGALRMAGTLQAEAASDAAVRLFAGRDATVDGRVTARTTRSGASGGDIRIGSALGQVRLGAGAHLDAGGDDAADGRIVLSAGRDDATGQVGVTAVAPDTLTARLTAGEIVVEAVRRYEGFDSLAAGSSAGTRLGQSSLRADSLAFFERATGFMAALGLDQDPRASLRTGIEIRSSGDFRIASDWNLWEAQRPGGQPGWLTIRAQGHLAVAGSLSDGFASAVRPNGNALTQPTVLHEGPAWSYRLVAGADTGAADPLATRAGAPADLSIAPDKLVRTTAGSIDLVAARDLLMITPSASAQQGVAYVAGQPSAVNGTLELTGSSWSAQFTSRGGALEVQAGRDVVSAPTTQQWGAWLYHTGVEDQTSVAWFSAFDAFRHGLGSFGGGALRVQAGRDVINLGAAVPTSARAERPPTSNPDEPAPLPVVENGGDLTVRAGGAILGGSFLLGRGHAVLHAGETIGTAPGFSPTRMPAIGPMLGLMEGRFSLVARGDVMLAGVVNPTMMPSANRSNAGRQRIGDADGAVFFTYQPDSALAALSQAGGVTWAAETAAGSAQSMSAWWSTLAGNGPTAERIDWTPKYQDPAAWAPPQVSLAALGGSLVLQLPGHAAGLSLFPSAAGRLSLHARDDLRLEAAANTLSLHLSDRDPARLPSTARPVLGQRGDIEAFSATTFDAPNDAERAGFTGLQAADGVPLRLYAGGDLNLRQPGRSSRVVLVSPRLARIEAGGDVLDFSLIGQHGADTDITRIEAGGSFLQGSAAGSNRLVQGGPGRLEVVAGRQIDLGPSQGIETVGNLYNSGLPQPGADLLVTAGARVRLDIDTFAGRYFADRPADDAAAYADAYLSAIGRDPTALSEDDRKALADGGRTLRQQLIDRREAWAALNGSDAAASRARRIDLVQAVRAATGLPPLAPADAEAGFDAAVAALRAMATPTATALGSALLDRWFGQAWLAPGKPYAERWQQAVAAAGPGADAGRFEGPAFEQVQREVLLAELNAVGSWAALVPASARTTREATYAMGFTAADLAGLGSSRVGVGDIDIVASGLQARQGGDITLLAAGGQINVGLPGNAAGSPQALKGIATYGQGSISAFASGDFQVNSQRVFVVGQGDITVWSSRGDIDAGRGANTAITVPPLQALREADGSIRFTVPSITVGSGIGILQPAVGQAAGNIGLYAPNGEVRALDAQIRAPGRIVLAAETVRGTDNVAGGSVAGAPALPSVAVTAPGPASSTTGNTVAAASAAGTAEAAARPRNALLLVELLGLGLPEDDCEALSDPAQRQACEPRRRGAGAPAR